MKHFAAKLRHNLIQFSIVFAALSAIPLILKLAATGSIGPNFSFYFYFAWLPLMTLAMATFKGWREGAITGFLVLGAFLVPMSSFPSDPSMDFQRQMIHEGAPWIMLGIMLSFAMICIFHGSAHLRPPSGTAA